MTRRLVAGADLTNGEKILIAMYRAGLGRLDPLEYEDIVVEAWRLFPETFALRGYPEFPDGSNIHKPLYRTLKIAGDVVPCGQKRFALTADGRRTAQQALDRVLGPELAPTGIDIEEEAEDEQ